MYENESAFAKSIVAFACKICVQVHSDNTFRDASILKSDTSPVTVADFAVQALVSLSLLRTSPFCEDGFIAEETSLPLRENAFLLQSVSTQVNLVLGPSKQASISEVLDAIDHGDSMGKERRYWVLDPIDGTRGFMSGDQYAVGLALIVDSRPVLGVLGCPSLAGGCLICGVVNEGATVESILLDDGKGQETLSAPTSAKPSSSSDICEAVFVHGERDTLLDNPELMEAYISSTGQQPAVLSICYGSLAKYAAICIGMGSAFMYLPNIQGVRRCHVWDHASGYACLVAAGGKVTDFHGDDLDFSTGRVIYVKSGLLVSANKSLHTALLSTFGAF